MRLSKRQLVLGVLLALGAFVVLLNWTWGRLPGEPERNGRIVRIGETSVRVLEAAGTGGRRAPAVVLIHGLPGTAEDFEDVLPLLRDRRTIAYDRPGYGFSDGGHHPLDRQLATLDALLSRLGAARPVLVGHSYGGTLALAYAARHPRAVGGLVLVDAAAGGEEPGFRERAQARLVQALSLPVFEPVAHVTFSQLLRTASAKQGDAAAFDPSEVDRRHERRLLAHSMRHEDLDAYAGELLAAGDVIAALDRRLPAIRTPAVVIQGDADQLVEPARGRALAAALPNARLVMVPSGHMPPYTHPGVIANAVRELAPSASATERERPADGR